jgi:hypothetical protein
MPHGSCSNDTCTRKVMKCHHLNLLSHTIHDWSSGVLDVTLTVPSHQNRPCGTNIQIHTLHRCVYTSITKCMYCKHSCISTVTLQFETKIILICLFFCHTVCWPTSVCLLKSVSCHTHVYVYTYINIYTYVHVYGCNFVYFCLIL